MNHTGNQPSLGVIFHPSFPPETLADYALRAEAGGFDELWLWDDCFLPGAFTSAAIALAATQRIKVGIGLLPVAAYNPLFAAMEITTLARAFPGRFCPGFGHGVAPWMAQIGSASKSPLKALQEVVPSVRRLLAGESVTFTGDLVHLDRVQMQMTPESIPPLWVGAMREKSLQLSGSLGDGTILTAMSSPAYVRWALEHIHKGMHEAGKTTHKLVVYLDVKVSPHVNQARALARRALVERLPWADIQLKIMGITAETAEFSKLDPQEAARKMPDEWLDAFSASGSPQQAASAVRRLFDAGADSVIFQPLNGDPACLDEYIHLLLPLLGR